MAGMGVTVTSTSGGQSGTLQSPKAAVAPHHLAGVTASKFRDVTLNVKFLVC